MQVLITTSILLFSSLAGCLNSEDNDSDEPTVLVSTYHVSEIVSAIGGSVVNVEIMAPSNIPVHDYEPTAADLVKLQNADLFLYHGLGLESWADATLETLGDDAPKYASTHAMPDGQSSYDYETLLIMDLCMHLSEGPYEEFTLMDEMEHADDLELHAEHLAYTLEMEEHDEEGDHDEHDHDDHAEDGDDHDDHDHAEDGDDHDDHDGHEGHNHISPLESPTPTSNCPAEAGVQIFHLDEGEYVLEFDIEEDAHEFNMVVLQMNGAHNHEHDHGEEDGDDHDEHDHGDEDGDDHDEHDHEDEEMVCYDMSTHTVDTSYDTETACESAGLMWTAANGGPDSGHGEADEMTAEHALEMFDTNNDSALSWDEFWDSFEEGHDHDEDDADDDGDHEDHGALEEAAEEYMMGKMMDAFNASDADNDTLLQLSELSTFMESMHTIEDGMESATVEIMMIAFDDDNDDQLSMTEFMHMMETMEDEDHDGEEEHNETEMMEMMFAMMDINEDDYLNASELAMFSDMDEHEEEMGYATLHIEETGDYGIAVTHSDEVKFHVMKSQGGHDDHAGHDDHTGHEDHDEDGDDHDEHDHGEDGDDHDDHADEEIAFDPHSWLDPLAYKAQVNLVLNEMKTAFPDLADTFQSNADGFMASLDNLHVKYVDAFGENGTCTNKAVAANHNAYSYLGQRYGLDFITIHGIDPEGEPTASDITEVVSKIKADGITVLFLEEYTAEGAVSSIVEQTTSSDMPNGVQTLTLYTMELPPKDSSDDYISLMQKNLDNLKIGLGC